MTRATVKLEEFKELEIKNSEQIKGGIVIEEDVVN